MLSSKEPAGRLADKAENRGLAGENIEQGTVLSVNVVAGRGPTHKASMRMA